MGKLLFALTLICALPLGGVLTVPEALSDVARLAGINFKLENSPTKQKYLPETMAGGVAVFDFDNDGRLDIFFTNGASIQDPMPPGATAEKTGERYWNRLFHQNADGTFSDVSAGSGLDVAGYGMGVAIGDINNDGLPDVLVTEYGGVRLFLNQGGGHFLAALPNLLVIGAVNGAFDGTRHNFCFAVVRCCMTQD